MYTRNTAELKMTGTLLITFQCFSAFYQVLTFVSFSLFFSSSFVFNQQRASSPSLLWQPAPFLSPCHQPPAKQQGREIKAHAPLVWGRKQEAIKPTLPTYCSRGKHLIKGFLKEQLRSLRLPRPWDAHLPSIPPKRTALKSCFPKGAERLKK